jgi:hypothetical protein
VVCNLNNSNDRLIYCKWLCYDGPPNTIDK